MISTKRTPPTLINWPCPKCGNRLRAIDTRPHENRTVRRVRLCACGHRIGTIEIDEARLVPAGRAQ